VIALWPELEVGSECPPLVAAPLTATDIVRYQGASGDWNPIHHDEGFARAAGFTSTFSVGMLQAGILASYLADWLGPANIRRFKVRFQAQAWPGDVITYSGAVTGKRVDGDQRLVDVECTAVRQTGEIHISGSATFALPR